MSLSQAAVTSPGSERYLLQLFMDDVARKLTQQAIDSIRPAVMEMAQKVVAEMEPRIRSAMDPMHDEVIVQLVVRDTK